MFILGSHQHAIKVMKLVAPKQKCIFLPGDAGFLVLGVFAFLSLMAMGSCQHFEKFLC
ncbi:hypothetical protein BWGOE4_23410 [Bacillus mycoides]|uniref:Uncharacterized protein n=1 Tax=Bacillus mycoides TaxID=1405 RepID=A0A1E8BPB9_BACMY|nr:hypothetical protein BWGOE2_22840 [Bacillus mycoides]OFD47860.1 hypothetical protein BWGOE1_23400 [Bacillus mycoides]OFD49448.1 hypothetical protein BWGOE3_22790 [Bacillus mycoides]OFD60766.1 hypothetical protein BWGOE6_23610 [Bacillus mycoides]OFD61807.1 hypothetical protein BWGOE4_23410 [Bacillus mycoides]